MDPTADVCKMISSFGKRPMPKEVNRFTLAFTKGVKGLVQFSNTAPTPGKFVMKASSVSDLHRMKDKYTGSNFKRARNTANPFETLGNSVFMNRAGVKIANVDAVLNLTGYERGFLAQGSPRRLTYTAIAEAPGAFVEYIQHRFPMSVGYGMSLRDSESKWNIPLLDIERFTVSWGKQNWGGDGSGNLYTNSDAFSDEVKAAMPDGVDLVVADGAIDSQGRELTQEQDNTRLMVTEMLTALQCLKKGGNFMFKSLDTFTDAMGHLMLIAAMCFESIVKFKPVSSRPANSESYVVCTGRRDDITRYITLLRSINERFDTEKYLVSIFDNSTIPPSFTKWMKEQNQSDLARQEEQGRSILAIMEWMNHNRGRDPRSQTRVVIPKYDLRKCFVVWNIPSNRDFESFFARRKVSGAVVVAGELKPMMVVKFPKEGQRYLFHVLQEGALEGGSLTRAFIPYFEAVNVPGFIVSASADDYAIVSMAVAAKKTGKDLVIYTTYSRDNTLIDKARSYGAKVIPVYRTQRTARGTRKEFVPIGEVAKEAKAYHSRSGGILRYISGSYDRIRALMDFYRNALSIAANGISPKRIWVAGRSGAAVSVLSSVFPKANLLVVKTRTDRIDLPRNARIAGISTGYVPTAAPYSTNPVDGRLWDYFVKKSMPGDYIWNPFSVDTLEVLEIVQPRITPPEVALTRPIDDTQGESEFPSQPRLAFM